MALLLEASVVRLSAIALDRFQGCILGHAVGDALGAPFEGIPPEAIYYQFGSARKIVAHPPVEKLVYTDDTQMTIGVSEALLADGRIVEESLCAAFVANYEPNRGYGPGARLILRAMSDGGAWREVAQGVFPGGSLGNGAAMRAAPIGLMFHADLDRLMEEAKLSALPTHMHPVGVEGAQLIALAVAMALRPDPFDRDLFYEALLSRAMTEEFRYPLSLAAKLGPDDTIAQFGHSLEAHRSVVTAIACFCEHPDSYPDVIARAIGLGGDADTIAAMARAISGARLGISSIPSHLLELLENGVKGRDYLFDLASRLHAVSKANGQGKD